MQYKKYPSIAIKYCSLRWNKINKVEQNYTMFETSKTIL